MHTTIMLYYERNNKSKYKVIDYYNNNIVHRYIKIWSPRNRGPDLVCSVVNYFYDVLRLPRYLRYVYDTELVFR